MNILLTPYAREERNPEPLFSGLLNFNSNDGLGRMDQLNFAASCEDEVEYPGGGAFIKKAKVSRQDPMSHRIIEKRRRDRMNSCLADLSRLIPPEYQIKKGRGRVEKTEIIEMAIRHLKYMEGRANAVHRQVGEENFRAGYQEAVGEAVRFLVEVRGLSPADALCMQLMSHMQRHVEAVSNGQPLPREKQSSLSSHHPNSSSEANSCSSSSQGFVSKGVITQAPVPAPQTFEQPYPMECDREGFELRSLMSSQNLTQSLNQNLSQSLTQRLRQSQLADSEVRDAGLPLDERRNQDTKLSAVAKPEQEDYLQSYKFKNSIERRFSRSQDSENTEAKDMSRAAHPQNKVFTHKRRRAAKPAPSTSTSTSNSNSNSNSGSTEVTRNNSPQDTTTEPPHHHHYDNKPTTHFVPIFALSPIGKYYVPLNVDYECLSRHLGPCDVLETRQVQLSASLHPITIHVNYQSSMNYLKRERTEEWRN